MLFRYNDTSHSFKYYLNKFFTKFFPNVDINILKKKYEEDLIKINTKLYNKNMAKIDESSIKIENEIKEDFDKMLYKNKLIWLKNKVIEIYPKINSNS